MSSNGDREAYVIGVGMTQFGRMQESFDLLAQRAAIEAMSDAEIDPDRVGAIFFGHVFGGRVAGQRIARDLGLGGRLLVNVENACASGASALYLAVQSVQSGAADVALALGAERLSVIGKGVIPPDENDLEGMLGRTNPATYALLAKRHMAVFGTTLEQLARVVVKARRNGSENPRAQVREPIGVTEVLESPMIAHPLTRFQCCPTGDGAAAAVIASKKAVTRQDRVARVAASIVTAGLLRQPDDPFTHHGVTRTAARAAFEAAALGPDDIDVAEIHDAFSIAELVHIEDLGFCDFGDAGRYVDSGAVDIGGRRPINPSGGLLARGHPLGASGLAQVFEIVSQLRRDCGSRQVERARVGLTHCEGGVVYGLDAGACAIHIFVR